MLKKISDENLFTLHNYLFNSHRVYLVKFLIRHPIYKSQLIGFDLKYNPEELIRMIQTVFMIYIKIKFLEN